MHTVKCFGMNTPLPIAALSQNRHTIDRSDEQFG
jgi:hypothetical protein